MLLSLNDVEENTSIKCIEAFIEICARRGVLVSVEGAERHTATIIVIVFKNGNSLYKPHFLLFPTFTLLYYFHSFFSPCLASAVVCPKLDETNFFFVVFKANKNRSQESK